MFYIIIIKGFIQFKTIFTKNIDKNISKGTLLKKYLLLKMYSKITWLSCILAFVIAILNFLLSFAFSNNMKALGPSVALISLSILYASIINIIITPFIMNTKEKLELLHE
jgi:membrane protein YdbS with pleckstrin-like domain